MTERERLPKCAPDLLFDELDFRDNNAFMAGQTYLLMSHSASLS